LELKNPHLVGGGIEIVNTYNLFCCKFAAVCPKLQFSALPTSLTHDTA